MNTASHQLADTILIGSELARAPELPAELWPFLAIVIVFFLITDLIKRPLIED